MSMARGGVSASGVLLRVPMLSAIWIGRSVAPALVLFLFLDPGGLPAFLLFPDDPFLGIVCR